jgi:competence protein ComEC
MNFDQTFKNIDDVLRRAPKQEYDQMKQPRRISFLGYHLAVLWLLFTFCNPVAGQNIGFVPDRLNVYIGNVGQADAILVRCPHGNHEMLIDAGVQSGYPKGSKMFKDFIHAHQNKDNRLELVVASHPHADHIGNMKYVFNVYDVDVYVDNGYPFKSDTYLEVLKAKDEEAGLRYESVRYAAPAVSFCPDVIVEIVRPAGFEIEVNDPNDRSVIVKMIYGDDSFLFVGDCEGKQEDMVLNDSTTRRQVSNIDFLKAGHHGSNTSSKVALLEVLKPKIIAVSAGDDLGSNKKYGHPRHEILVRFNDYGGPRQGKSHTAEVYFTTDEGKKSKTKKQVVMDKAVYLTNNIGELHFFSTGSGISRVIYD